MRFSRTLMRSENIGFAFQNSMRETGFRLVPFSLPKLLSLGLILLALGVSACSESELVLDGDRIPIISANETVFPDP